jgi:hypothetical protein
MIGNRNARATRTGAILQTGYRSSLAPVMVNNGFSKG